MLDSFQFERHAADRHVLEVSDRIHGLARKAVQSARSGVRSSPPTPEQSAALVRSRCMLDVSYAGSPLVGEHLAAGVEWPSAPAPGERYPDRVALNGTEHHVVLFGAADAAAVDHLSRRWYGLLNVVTATDHSRAPSGSESGALLVRPDGHVGFRAAPADARGLAALDTHLHSYLRAA